MLPRSRPLPYAARPFPEEPLGGWLGRVAGFYRMDIDEFAAHLGVDLGLDAKCSDWLFLRPQATQTLERIGYLTRTAVPLLRALEVDEKWRAPIMHYRFCWRCLFVNRLDVTAPRWVRAWMDPDFDRCGIHDEVSSLKARALRQCRNFAPLLEFAGSQIRMRDKGRRRWAVAGTIDTVAGQ